MSRKIVLKRIDVFEGQFALHDEETGEILAGQVNATIISKPQSLVKVVVEFESLPGSRNGFTIVSDE